ncbi:hypothetical protein K474DRAFT_1680262 [Panus rudis PR-1116 ss-1]|nr:hypothetical protein K474DRAFT_1680262 [Panus rudis PR-1116 ss-1]
MSETVPTVASAAESLSALESRLTGLGAPEAIVDAVSELSTEVHKVKLSESALAGGRIGRWSVAKRVAKQNRAVNVQSSCNDLLEADDFLSCFDNEEDRSWATLIVTDVLAAVKAVSDRLAAFDNTAAPPPPAAPPRLSTPARRTSQVPMGPPTSSRSRSSTAASMQVNKCKREEPSASGRPPKVARGASAVAGESATEAAGVATPVSTGSRPARTPAKRSSLARAKTSSKAAATPARTSGRARKPKKSGDFDMSEDDSDHFANPVTNEVGPRQQRRKAALYAPADWSAVREHWERCTHCIGLRRQCLRHHERESGTCYLCTKQGRTCTDLPLCYQQYRDAGSLSLALALDSARASVDQRRQMSEYARAVDRHFEATANVLAIHTAAFSMLCHSHLLRAQPYNSVNLTPNPYRFEDEIDRHYTYMVLHGLTVLIHPCKGALRFPDGNLFAYIAASGRKEVHGTYILYEERL